MRSRRISALAGLTGSVALAALVTLAGGCSPVVRNHGYTPLPEELAELQVGLDTRYSVQSKIGRPAGTGIFTDNGWYYVSNKVERLTYHAPEVVDRRVVELLFDQNDVLASVTEYGLEDGRVIDLETKTTPTYGRQLTILEQAFGNIGVITEDSLDTLRE
jgi:outer membrane protein assembly factor BamE (lipoprotein component of BamABCDE complex)